MLLSQVDPILTQLLKSQPILYYLKYNTLNLKSP